jgi:hypothetical protein
MCPKKRKKCELAPLLQVLQVLNCDDPSLMGVAPSQPASKTALEEGRNCGCIVHIGAKAAKCYISLCQPL